jgi:hypothetical protein
MIPFLTGCGAAPDVPVADAPGVPASVAEAPAVPADPPPSGDIPLSAGTDADRAALFTVDDIGVDRSKELLTRRRTGTTWELQYSADPPAALVQSGAYIAETEEAAIRAWNAIGYGAASGADDQLSLEESPEKPGWGSRETCMTLQHDGARVGWYCWSQRGTRVGTVMVMAKDPGILMKIEPFAPRAAAAFARIDRWTP